MGPRGAFIRAASEAAGKKAEDIAEREAAKDVGGDLKFRGWAPVLDTKWRLIDEGVLITPTRSSAGPWTVAEQGRNQGNASGFAGPGSTRTGGAIGRTKAGGVRSTRARAGKRWNGRTRGRRTATRTVAAFERELPKVVLVEWGKFVKSKGLG